MKIQMESIISPDQYESIIKAGKRGKEQTTEWTVNDPGSQIFINRYKPLILGKKEYIPLVILGNIINGTGYFRFCRNNVKVFTIIIADASIIMSKPQITFLIPEDFFNKGCREGIGSEIAGKGKTVESA
jgi:hypothetical protein